MKTKSVLDKASIGTGLAYIVMFLFSLAAIYGLLVTTILTIEAVFRTVNYILGR